jgi:hypothetical protein
MLYRVEFEDEDNLVCANCPMLERHFCGNQKWTCRGIQREGKECPIIETIYNPRPEWCPAVMV